MSEEVDKSFDILGRLSRFKPKSIRYCDCAVCNLANAKPMEYHYVYRCRACGGKILPEHVAAAKVSLERLKTQYGIITTH